MCVAQTGAYLLDVLECLLQAQLTLSNKLLQVAAGQIFEDKVVKNSPPQVACRAMAKPADDIWVTDAIECDGLILKILDQRPLEVIVEIILEKNVECL